MDVQLPDTGCNIINNATSFYNYSADGKTRDVYYIYEGVAHLQSSSYNQYGYTYSGTCLQTGDLIFRPEYKEFIFPLASIIISLLLFYFAYKLMLSHWWRKK